MNRRPVSQNRKKEVQIVSLSHLSMSEVGGLITKKTSTLSEHTIGTSFIHLSNLAKKNYGWKNVKVE